MATDGMLEEFPHCERPDCSECRVLSDDLVLAAASVAASDADREWWEGHDDTKRHSELSTYVAAAVLAAVRPLIEAERPKTILAVDLAEVIAQARREGAVEERVAGAIAGLVEMAEILQRNGQHAAARLCERRADWLRDGGE
jgi:hypothetical protein